MRKMIYISSQDIWDEVIKAAGGQNRSVSNYLINLHVEFSRKTEESGIKEGASFFNPRPKGVKK